MIWDITHRIIMVPMVDNPNDIDKHCQDNETPLYIIMLWKSALVEKPPKLEQDRIFVNHFWHRINKASGLICISTEEDLAQPHTIIMNKFSRGTTEFRYYTPGIMQHDQVISHRVLFGHHLADNSNVSKHVKTRR